MDRKNANQKYKWNLKAIYATDKLWEKDYEELKLIYPKLALFKGKLKDKDSLLDYLELEKQIGLKLNKLMYYSYLSHDINLDSSKYNEQLGLLENLEANISTLSAFALPELNTLSDDELKELINDKRFFNFDNFFKDILLNRKHLLSEKEETALSLVNSFAGGFSKIYDDLTEVDTKFKPITINGKESPLTIENFSLFITNEDRDIRKQAYNNLYEKYKEISHTLASSYIYYLKSTSFDLKLRNYTSLLSAHLYSSQIDEKVYYNLIDNVNKNLHLMHRYFKLLKKVKNIDEMHFYDTYLSIANNFDKHYDIETQYQIVKQALKCLGEDYQNKLETAFNNNWIDVYSGENKSSGGYNFCIYTESPHIFLNDNGNYNSLSTLAHELGHAMHSAYTNETQSYEKSDIVIFLAEIASTVNEILLNKYLLKNTDDKNEKIFLLDQFIKNTKATVFRQTMFSEFEDYAHKLVEQDKPISDQILNNEYKNLLEKHFGDAVILDDKIIYEWTRISHFFRSYYVYKYATSYVCANYIASNIFENKNDMFEKYIKLLKSGSSDYPTNLLKLVDIDLTKNDVYDLMFKDLEKAIDELEKLTK